MCNAQRGSGSYGSSSGYQPPGMNRGNAFQPTNQNPQFQNAMGQASSRMSRFPGYQPPQMPQTPWNPNQGGPIGRGGMPDFREARTGTGGYSPIPQMPTPDMVQPGLMAPVDKPMQVPTDSGLHPYTPPQQMPQAPMPGGVESQQNYANVAGFRMPQSAGFVGQAMSPPAQSTPTQSGGYPNPWGFSQQQLGPTFNPFGSSQGGYFNGNNWVPHVGNPRNGLDTLYAAGQMYNGMPR